MTNSKRRASLDDIGPLPPKKKKTFQGASIHPTSRAGLFSHVGSNLEHSIARSYLTDVKAEISAMAAVRAADNAQLDLKVHTHEILQLRQAQAARARLDLQERMIQRMLGRPFPAPPSLLQDQFVRRHQQALPFSQARNAVAAVAGSSTFLQSPVPRVRACVTPVMPDQGVKIAAVQPTKIPCMPLASGEDENYLSSFHCFLRKELVEVFFANAEDVASRNISQQVFVNQVGIRCKCCSHVAIAERAPRSMAFPSSIAQLYQSFTMMLREHFSRCTEIDASLKQTFLELRDGKTTQGVASTKDYWEHAAKYLGMVDSSSGIFITEESQTAAVMTMNPLGSDCPQVAAEQREAPVMLIYQHEQSMTKSDLVLTLLEQVQRVHLLPDECRGNRKTLQAGLPGLACKHCCKVGRLGQSRVFPVKKRTLSTKLEDMFDHLQRCTLCPSQVKESLQSQRKKCTVIDLSTEPEFYALVWARLKKGPEAVLEKPSTSTTTAVVPTTTLSCSEPPLSGKGTRENGSIC